MRIDHINIVVTDIKKSMKFYTEVIGLNETLQLKLTGDWMEEITGFQNSQAKCVFLEPSSKNCRIELLEYENPSTICTDTQKQQKLNLQGIRHIALEVDNINDIYQKALQFGVESISKPIHVPLEVVPSGKILCYLKAPDGVILELAQYTN